MSRRRSVADRGRPRQASRRPAIDDDVFFVARAMGWSAGAAAALAGTAAPLDAAELGESLNAARIVLGDESEPNRVEQLAGWLWGISEPPVCAWDAATLLAWRQLVTRHAWTPGAAWELVPYAERIAVQARLARDHRVQQGDKRRAAEHWALWLAGVRNER